MNDELVIRAVKCGGGEVLEIGKIYTCEFVTDEETLAWVDRKSQSKDGHVLLFSRLPHRRLLEHLDINSVEAYWLTERITDGAVRPDLDEISKMILAHLSNHNGVVVLEGLEWLVTQNGEDNTLGFIRMLRESVHRKQWTILIPIRTLAFNPQWLARLRREAPSIELSSPPESSTVLTEQNDRHEVKSEVFGSTPLTILDDGSPQLVQLTRLPYNGFTNSLLRKRILQWRRMGLDVSEVEPALNATDIEQSYALYAVVEEKVRQAVELDRYITANSGILTASEETSARFRIRQLTGLEELAKIYFVD